MFPQAPSRLWILLLMACFSRQLAQADPPATAEARVRAAGVEPTVEGVRGYLESVLAPTRDKEVDKLIGQLGDQDFATRERATQQLLRSGLSVDDKLEAARKSSDPEVALRAETILKDRSSSRQTLLLSALQLVEEKKLAVGLPLLLKIHANAAPGPEQEAAASAMVAVVEPQDRELVAGLLKQEDRQVRNVARRLLARLDRAPAAPLLEGVFDAVFVKPGVVAGGGPNLIQGWEFEAKADLVVTHLGIYDDKSDGLAQGHAVAIWDIKDAAKPVAEQTVPAGEEAALAGVFRMMPVERVRLEKGKRYAIVAHYDEPLDSAVSMDNPSSLTVKFADHLEVIGRRYTFPHKGMAFPEQLAANVDSASLGPTLRYEVSDEPRKE